MFICVAISDLYIRVCEKLLWVGRRVKKVWRECRRGDELGKGVCGRGGLRRVGGGGGELRENE